MKLNAKNSNKLIRGPFGSSSAYRKLKKLCRKDIYLWIQCWVENHKHKIATNSMISNINATQKSHPDNLIKLTDIKMP